MGIDSVSVSSVGSCSFEADVVTDDRGSLKAVLQQEAAEACTPTGGRNGESNGLSAQNASAYLSVD